MCNNAKLPFNQYMINFRGKKITCPGAQDKENFNKGKHIFSSNVRRASNNYSARLYLLECPVLFGNRTSKNLGVLVHRTSEHFKIFVPLIILRSFWIQEG